MAARTTDLTTISTPLDLLRIAEGLDFGQFPSKKLQKRESQETTTQAKSVRIPSPPTLSHHKGRKYKQIHFSPKGERASRVLHNVGYNIDALPPLLREPLLQAASSIAELHFKGSFELLRWDEYVAIKRLHGDGAGKKYLAEATVYGVLQAERVAKLAKIFCNVQVITVEYAQLGCKEFASLAAFKNLDSLQLHFCSINEPAGLGQLQKCRVLTDLGIKNCANATDAAAIFLATLPYLNSLQITGHDSITDIGLRAIVQLSALQELDISYSHITDGGLDLIFKNCKKLTMLWLTGCPKITKEGVMSLGEHPKLKYIEIDSCRSLTEDFLDKVPQLSVLPFVAVDKQVLINATELIDPYKAREENLATMGPEDAKFLASLPI